MSLGTRSSSSSALSDEESRAAAVYAESECDRKRPHNRAAYRATVLARKCEEIVADRESARAFQARITAAGASERTGVLVPPSDRCLSAVDVQPGIDADTEPWEPDPIERRAIRERALLLARMEREQGCDPTW